MLTNVDTKKHFTAEIERFEQRIAALRVKLQGVRLARLCPATAHRSNRGKRACFGCKKDGCFRFRQLGLDDEGSPLAEDQRPACGAKTKTGAPCDVPVVPGKRRCRMHGGLSTGPKSEEGRERIREAQRKRWKRSRST